MDENKTNKCALKCKTCDYYNKKTDFCSVKQIENCSKAALKTDFSTCTDYLISEQLVMF